MREADGRVVALKILRNETLDRQAQHRFLREVSALSRVRHRNVVQLIDCSDGTGQPCWLALERLRGNTLRDLLRADRRAVAEATTVRLLAADPHAATQRRMRGEAQPPPTADGPLADRTRVPQLLEVGIQIAEGLEALHAAGVLHRDLNPGNVIIEPDGRTVLMDFGLARGIEDETITHSRELLGTLGFQPPEALHGTTGSVRGDVYALGATLYAALAGRPPHDGDTAAQLLRGIAHSSAPRLDELNPAVGADLARVLARALARDPRDRHASAAELRADLQSVREGRRPAHQLAWHALMSRLQQWTWRAALLAGAGALVLLSSLLWSRSPAHDLLLEIERGDLGAAIARLNSIPDSTERQRVVDAAERSRGAGRNEPLQRVLAAAHGEGLIRFAIEEDEHVWIWSGPTDEELGGLEPTRGEFVPLAESPLVRAPAGKLCKVVFWIDDEQEAWGPGDPALVTLLLRPPRVTLDDPLPTYAIDQLPTRAELQLAHLCRPLAADRHYWAEFASGTHEVASLVRHESGEFTWPTRRLMLPNPLAVARCELAAQAVVGYLTWLRRGPGRLPWFAHPEEPADHLDAAALERELDQALALGVDQPARVDFWLAFRIAGHLRCRLPSLANWVMVAQQDRGVAVDRLRAARADDYEPPGQFRSVRAPTEDCGEVYLVQDMSGHAREWTLTVTFTVYRFCPIGSRHGHAARFQPRDLVGGAEQDACTPATQRGGLRLFRFRLPP